MRSSLCAAAVLALLTTSGVATATAGSASAGSVPPAAPETDTAIGAMSADAPDDVWAIERRANPDMWRWNGSAWQTVAVRVPCAGASYLADVSAVSRTSVWTVGECQPGQRIQTRVMRWDGSRFVHVRSPNPDRSDRLLTVTALSDTDVWVGGVNSGGGRALVMRYDGNDWRVLRTPRIRPVVDMYVASDTDVWVAGDNFLTHWDGKAWDTQTFPTSISFDAIAGAAGDDVWAVGEYDTQAAGKTDAGRYSTYAAHWDGSTWTPVSLPKAPGVTNSLHDISVTSEGDAWAVGDYRKGSAGEFVEHWDGTEWTIVQVYKNDDPYAYGLNAVAAIGPDDVWAGGDLPDPSTTTHWDGSDWTAYALP